jgi:hypothetical protein
MNLYNSSVFFLSPHKPNKAFYAALRGCVDLLAGESDEINQCASGGVSVVPLIIVSYPMDRVGAESNRLILVDECGCGDFVAFMEENVISQL